MLGFCKRYVFVLLVLLPMLLWAQRGRHGSKTITNGTFVVNEYTALTANALAGSNSISVASGTLNANARFAGPLAAGELVMIIQMQGAKLFGSGPNNHIKDQYPAGTIWADMKGDTSWGKIYNYENCGNYEFAQVKSVSGNVITLECPLTKSYSATDTVTRYMEDGLGNTLPVIDNINSRTQVIRVPRYTDLTLVTTSTGGILSCDTWNGTIGGVVVVEVKYNTVIADPGSRIDASGKGFRGGTIHNHGYWNSNDVATDNATWGAEKGEGIGGYQTVYNSYGGRYCKGAPGNGGGGGDGLNCGGGGGANGGNPALWRGRGIPDLSGTNYSQAWNLEFAGFSTLSSANSSGGGQGGYGYGRGNGNALVDGPNNATAWGGATSKRESQGGRGGRPLDYSTGKLFLGGGGGAGDEDNNTAGAGGNGGGLIYVMSYGTISGLGSIQSNGNNGSSTSGSNGIDGAGGGGGGGTIVLNSVGLVSGIVTSANGGAGGNQKVLLATDEAEGPGGGGSGGYITVSNVGVSQSVYGGVNGTTNSKNLTEFLPNGATAGAPGSTGTITNYYITKQNDTICAKSTTTLNASIVGTGPGSGSLEWYDAATGGNQVGTGATFTTPVLSTTTVYYVGVCPGTYRDSVVVVVNALNKTTSKASSCGSGGTATVTPSGGQTPYTYLWSDPGAQTNATATGLGAGTYTVTFTDKKGCSDTAIVTINAGSGGINTTTSVIDVKCKGSATGSATAVSSTGGSSPYTYSWQGTGQATQTASNLSAGITYTVITTDNVGCTATQTVLLTEPSTTLNVTSTTSVDDTCKANTGKAMIVPSGGTSGYTYSWPTRSETTSSITGLMSGTYTVSVTDANLCSASATIVVNAYNQTGLIPLSTSGTITNASCYGKKDGEVTVLASNYISSLTYSWNTAPSQTSAQATGLAAGVYTVTVSNNGVCTSTKSFTITAPPIIPISFTSNTPAACGAANGSVTANTTASSPTYLWDNGQTTATLTAVSAGTYTVTVTSQGCTHDSVVTIGSTGGVVLSAPATVDAKCNKGSDGQITVNIATPSVAPYSYSWTPGGVTQTSNVITGLTAGPYTVSVKDANNCVTTQSLTITEPVPITFSVKVTDANCGSANGSALINPPSGGTSGYTYSWSNNAVTNQINGLSANTYIATVIDANGCSATQAAIVQNTGAPTLSVTGQQDVSCFGKTDGKATVLPSTGNYSYSWSSPTPQATATATGLGLGVYSVTVTDLSTNCSGIATVSITAPTDIAVSVSKNDIPCNSSTLGDATASATGGNSGYTYSWNNSQIAATATGLQAGAYTVTVTDSKSCSGSQTVLINSGGNVVADAGADQTILIGSTVTLGGATSGVWNPASDLSCNNCANPVALPLITTTYTLTVTDANGCSATDVVTITVDNKCGEVFVPTAFSPNEDGVNDELLVRGNCINTYQIYIYNRWGEKVFESTDLKAGWNGKFDGKLLDTGVYVYYYRIVRSTGEIIERKGNITLTR